MAVTVLEHGNVPTYRGTCFKCGCRIQCNMEDLQYERNITSLPPYVVCPGCGERIMITEYTIPAGYSASVSASVEPPTFEQSQGEDGNGQGGSEGNNGGDNNGGGIE